MVKIRISSLPYYQDCPRRASVNLFRYEIENAGFKVRESLPGIAASVGTGTHGAAAAINNAIKETGTPGDLKRATEEGIETLKKEIRKGVVFDDTTPNTDHAEKQIATLARSYYYELVPQLNLDHESCAFEKQLTATLDADTLISGSPDLADNNQIRDTKTGRESSFDAQMGGYSLLRKSNKNPRPKSLIVDFLPRTAIAKPYPGAHSIHYDVSFCEYYAYNIIRTIKRDIAEFLKNGDPWAFMPNPKSSLCGEKYCAAFKTGYCLLGGCGK